MAHKGFNESGTLISRDRKPQQTPEKNIWQMEKYKFTEQKKCMNEQSINSPHEQSIHSLAD